MMYQILQGDNRDTLKTLADNSIDAIVTDPPYGIDFLGKAWDANTGALETYQQCLRVLKPGGHILAFSAARTYHHLAVTLEQAGFEIRDQIMWIYSSGFPKSQDIGRSIARSENKLKNTKTYLPEIADNRNVANSTTGSPRCLMCKTSGWVGNNTCSRADCIRPWEPDLQDNEWNGWGTQLKPAHEPIALARKPIKLSIARNCQTHGVGALNIDATRIDWEPGEQEKEQAWREKYTKTNTGGPIFAEQKKNDLAVGGQTIDAPPGRFPSNVIGEIRDYQKYFYCPKVSRAERHIGHALDIDRGRMVELMGGYWCDDLGTPGTDGKSVWLPHTGLIYAHGLTQVYAEWCKANNKDPGKVGNNHPTVKPIELMKYLIKLITPEGGTVLDPFTGSGSTGCAAVELGHTFIGCELDPAYVDIANRRIEARTDQSHNPDFDRLFTTA